MLKIKLSSSKSLEIDAIISGYLRLILLSSSEYSGLSLSSKEIILYVIVFVFSFPKATKKYLIKKMKTLKQQKNHPLQGGLIGLVSHKTKT